MVRPPRRNKQGITAGQVELVFWDLVKKAMQLAALATVLMVAYLAYGCFSGGISDWSALNDAAKLKVAGNIQGTIFYLNVSLIILVVTASLLYHSEDGMGYALVVLALALYYGTPLLVDMTMANQVADWEAARNAPALAIYNEARIAGLILLVPGALISLYDLYRRATSPKRTDLTACQYGGDTEEEKSPSPAIIGVLGKCYQMAYCREFIRLRCPIYHKRTRCWRHRVGCMCEEAVIRGAMAAMMDDTSTKRDGPVNFAEPLDDDRRIDLDVLPGQAPPKPVKPPAPKVVVIPKNMVKVPYNTRLPMEAKRERCRNCVIYNEHQRLKYAFAAPILVLAVPGLVYLRFDIISGFLTGILDTADRVMAKLSLDPNSPPISISAATTSSDVANMIMIVCLTVILTTMILRGLEYAVFRLKI